MNWLDKWAIKRAERAMLNKVSYDEMAIPAPKVRSNSIGTIATAGQTLDSNGMNFKIYKASGGVIVETHMYDRKTDRANSGLYIVTDDKDLGQEISKIITMESLRV